MIRNLKNFFYRMDRPLRYLLSLQGYPLSSLKEPLIKKCDSIFFELDLRDPLQRKICFGLYEKRDLKRILPLIRPGCTYIDVGANVGFYTLHFAKKIQGKGEVYSFEADPMVFSKLQKNCQLNGFSDLHLFPLALSNHNGTTRFYQSQDACTGSGSLESFADIKGPIMDVPTMTLDTFLEKNQIRKVELIKIDIEAHEIALAHGMKNSLRNQIYKYIFIEFNGPRLREKGHSFEEFFSLFGSYGYRPHPREKLPVNPEESCFNVLLSI